MNIKAISILTEEQFEKYHFWLPECNDSYWILGNVNDNDLYNYQFVSDGYNYCNDVISRVDLEHGIRPILIIEGIKRERRSKITLFDIKWTVIDASEDEIIIVSDEVITYDIFDLKSSQWETSFLKHSLEDWLEDMKEKYKNETIKPTYEELQEKLKEIGRKIEEGRLIDVSFIPGDEVWFINCQTIFHGTVENVQYNAEKDWIIVSGLTDDDKPFVVSKDNVYATKEDVDKAFFEINPF